MPNTPNFSLPLLFAAQAQKEITHNEALIVIDALLAGSVNAVLADPGALDPDAGDAWIIGTGALGEWAGRAGQIAIFTDGGWRFVPVVGGMRVLDRATGQILIFDGSDWLAPAAVADPAGGATVDAEARATLGALLSALRDAGLIDAT